MRAVIWTNYGPPEVLQLREVAQPSPRDDEVLIKILATTVTAGDCEARGLTLPHWVRLPMRLFVGLRRPQRITILGQELAGEIVAMGKDVTGFRPGDQVFAATSIRFGAYAEYICMPATSAENMVAMKPANLTFEEAAALPVSGLEALHFVQQSNLQRGASLLINGAGGSIGTATLQLAKNIGAEITAVDRTAKLAALTALGADHVVDYTQQDFTRNGRQYDVILDVVGKVSLARGMQSLKPGGCYLSANPRVSTMVRGWWIAKTSDKRVITSTSGHRAENLALLKELAETGKIKPVIDRCYPLEAIVEAHRYVETGSKTGNVVITVDHHA